jgi:CheY-like chemotaxis protein
MKPVKKILLADDDPEDRDIIEDVFVSINGGGFTQYARDGVEALAYLNMCIEEGTLPGLIILDLNMPRLNGTQTLKAIKKDHRLKAIPVYIYSTSLNPIERDECMLMGAQDYIIKPTTYSESFQVAKHFFSICEKDDV